MAGAPVIGREPELDIITRWIRDAAEGVGRLALIEGEPGIGKSALLREARRLAVEAGCTVFWAAGEELSRSFPLLPLLTTFSLEPASADQNPAAMAESLIARVDHLCAQSPAVLVVDDLHWADTATIAVCYRLARSSVQRSLLLIGAMRPLPRRDDLNALRRAVQRTDLLRLQPLASTAVTALVTELTGGDPGPGLAKVAADAAGNPFYVTELVDALRRAGGVAVQSGVAELINTAVEVPASLRDAIADRLNFLSPPTRDALLAAALLGDEFSVDELAAVTGHRLPVLAQQLADAHAAGVLAEAGARMAFRHPLIRATLYAETAAPVRVTLHRDAAYALYQAGAPAPKVARQLLPVMSDLAEDLARNEWVIDWLISSAPTLAGEASEVAAALLREAVTHLPVDDARRHLLTVYLARALAYLTEHDEVEALVTATLPHVTEPSLLVDLYDALVTARDASLLRLEETLAELDRVIIENPQLPADVRLRLNVLAARVELKCGEPGQAVPRARQALATATEMGDRWSIGWTCSVLSASRWLLRDIREPFEMMERGLAATADDPNLLDLHLLLLANRGLSEGVIDLFEQSQATLSQGRRIAERTGKVRRGLQMQRSVAQVYFDMGRWDDALVEAALPGGEDPYSAFQAMNIIAAIKFHRGDPTANESLAAAKALGARMNHGDIWMMTDALAHEVAGNPRAALQVLSNGLAQSIGLIDIEFWLPDIVRLAMMLGETDTAKAATDEAEAAASAADPLPRRAAIAMHCQGLLRADPELVLKAARGYAEIKRPLLQAQALEAAAARLAERGDTPAARGPFAAALDVYGKLGADWDLTRMRTQFKRHKMHPPTRRRHRPATGWESLTKTEAKVAQLVALGRSNPEIAEELVVSRRTVETHVTHILAKLQLRSRVELVRVAATREQQARPLPPSRS